MKLDINKEILIVWTIYSFSILVFLIILFSMDDTLLLAKSPICLNIKLNDKPCIMCGMTRAFLEIKKYHWANSIAYNRMSISLFVLMIINTFFYIKFLTKKICKQLV